MKTESEWRATLTPELFAVTREGATEDEPAPTALDLDAAKS
ncbi:MAG TPA: hypothetical protein VFH85_01230 [Gammaproteobacteria bacterium]|nr:hypothetical protein [Gammaproteobacteria bacterium]